MALGAVLKEARERKGMTPQQVAEETRMLVQIVRDLECEDFSRIAASLYGRGFIKLYAECVGVDPESLVAEFMDIYTGNRPPQILRRALPPRAAPADPKPTAAQPLVAPLLVPPETLLPPKLDEQRVPAAPPLAAKARVKPPLPAAEPVPSTAKNSVPEVMPLDSPADASPDLFSVAQEKKSTRVQPMASDSPKDETTPVPPPPRVRPFSGQNAALAPDEHPSPQLAAVRPAIKRVVAPAWTKTRVVVRDVAKIWSGVSRLPVKWLTPLRLAIVAGTIFAALIVGLGLYALKKLAERPVKLAEQSAPRTMPGLSERVLPPPAPYIE